MAPDDEGYVSPHDRVTLSQLHDMTLAQPDSEPSDTLDDFLWDNPSFVSLMGRKRPASNATDTRFFTPITEHAAAIDDVETIVLKN